MLELQGLKKSYEGFTLEVDTALPRGVVGLFGVSGSGKTTILNCIAGLLRPDAGNVMLNGRVLFSEQSGINLPPERRGIGYVFQDALLFPHLRVRDNLRYGFRLVDKKHRRLKPADLAGLLDLEPLEERYPATLSGGERQRVALARALATSPDLLLLDEPMASLDMRMRGRILQHLQRVWEELRIPMLYVSHAMSEVMALASHVVVLDQGHVVSTGPPRQVLADPHVFGIADATGVENLLPVKVAGHREEAGLTELDVGPEHTLVTSLHPRHTPGEQVFMSIPASDVLISLDRPKTLSARNVQPARVVDIHLVGSKVLIYACAGAVFVVELTQDALTELALQVGQEIFLIIKSSSIRLLDA